jgi:hypothetical protein
VAASVSGNVLRRIGQQTVRGSLRAGIAAAGVQRLHVIGNNVTDIAPAGEFIGVAAGVLVLAPSSDVDIRQNHVARELQPTPQPTDPSTWFALLMDQPFDHRVVSRVATRAAVRLDDSRTLVFGNRRPFVVAAPTFTDVTGAAAVRATSTSILGNVFEARGSTPAVDVAVSGDCVFSDNRCEQLARSGAAAVRMAARTTIVNANRVRGGEVSIQLISDARRITVLGNITTGSINHAGGALGAPWDALNVRG